MEVFAFVWVASVVGATAIGAHKGSPITGFLLGFIFGPLGVLATLIGDSRAQCPKCLGKLPAGKPAICLHCKTALAWDGSRPKAVETLR